VSEITLRKKTTVLKLGWRFKYFFYFRPTDPIFGCVSGNINSLGLKPNAQDANFRNWYYTVFQKKVHP